MTQYITVAADDRVEARSGVIKLHGPEGFDGMPVKGGLIDVPDRPGLGVNLVPKEAKKYLTDGDANFFD